MSEGIEGLRDGYDGGNASRLTVVVDGLRHHRLQRKQLPRGQSNGGLEAQPDRVQVKFLFPHLRIGNCSREREGKGWGAQSGNKAVCKSTKCK